MLAPRQLAAFRKRLLEWFRQFQRDLPWRRARDPYRIWLSEIMLQQTRVAVVIPYYERFLERFPTVQTLAAAPEEDVLRAWSGLGYYSRARNLHKAAQQIVSKHRGAFPEREEDALGLPGIGRYTAAAILSIAFGKRLAVLDGNVARVLCRIGAVRGNLREPQRWQSLQEMANRLLDTRSPGDWNQAMMELGATLCTPCAPQCLLCPVTEFCRARRLGIAESLPLKQEKPSVVEITLAAAVFSDPHGRTLLLSPPQKSNADDIATLVSRLWHFPAIAIREDAAAEMRNFLSRFLQKASQPLHLEPLAKVRHTVTYRRLTILPFRIAVEKIPRLSSAKAIRLADFSSVPVSNLTRKIAHAALQNSAPASANR